MAGRRRTNPVKEVERLEKNREQRRARIAETREEKRSMMKKDPGNLNWEFSAMIKYSQLIINLIFFLKELPKFYKTELMHFHLSNLVIIIDIDY